MKSSTTPGIFKTADSPDGSNESAVLLYEKVDQWMRDSVVEIVKNLREAPLSVGCSLFDINQRSQTSHLDTRRRSLKDTIFKVNCRFHEGTLMECAGN
ncbi:hypothetical protein NC653_031250 [Populus alba x Populus x berolinensis]|uniref:DUF7804 domain-containing protein n=1 Tax=Populus alba x Populus x berolinensis TaxID=444605 RepID=A0AAD6Q341_9ROSI|nr:hypothetical protein NC653_031250 [Populus alba x Populus x berolinensis]